MRTVCLENSLFSWTTRNPYEITAVIVEDASQDATTRLNELVIRAPFIRFFAGFPVWVSGYCIGAICAVDFKAHAGVESNLISGLKSVADALSAALSINRETFLGPQKLVNDMLHDVRTPLTSIRYGSSIINQHNRRDSSQSNGKNFICEFNLPKNATEIENALDNYETSMDQLSSNMECYEIYRRALELRVSYPELCPCDITGILNYALNHFHRFKETSGVDETEESRHFNLVLDTTKFDQLKYVGYPSALSLLILAIGKVGLPRWGRITLNASLSPTTTGMEVPVEYMNDYFPADLVLQFTCSQPLFGIEINASESEAYLFQSIETIISAIPSALSIRSFRTDRRGEAGEGGVTGGLLLHDQAEYRIPCLVTYKDMSTHVTPDSVIDLDETRNYNSLSIRWLRQLRCRLPTDRLYDSLLASTLPALP